MELRIAGIHFEIASVNQKNNEVWQTLEFTKGLNAQSIFAPPKTTFKRTEFQFPHLSFYEQIYRSELLV